jgi:hypothetical protein
LIWPKECETGIEVDLPEDFDSPFEDDEPEALPAKAVTPCEKVASEEGDSKRETIGAEQR